MLKPAVLDALTEMMKADSLPGGQDYAGLQVAMGKVPSRSQIFIIQGSQGGPQLEVGGNAACIPCPLKFGVQKDG